MGREYNIFEMEEANYEEILKAFKGIDGRKIKANFGLDPSLENITGLIALFATR